MISLYPLSLTRLSCWLRLLRARARRRLIAGSGLLFLAALVGLGAGLAAVVLEWSVHGLTHLCFGESLASAPTTRLVLVPVLGNLLVAALLRILSPQTMRNGVAEVIYTLARRGGRLPWRAAPLTLLTSAISISTGGSVGPEGPIVQAGAGVGSSLGRMLGLPPHVLRVLVGCGAAGGIAGIFNAPVAGVLFAAEVVLGHLAISTLLPILLAAVVAAAVARAYTGGAVLFTTPPPAAFAVADVPLYLAVGLFAGLVSVYFIRAVVGTEDLFRRLAPHWLPRALLGGLALVGFGLLLPHTLGSGSDTVAGAIDGPLVQQGAILLLAIALVKVLSTAITLGSGGTGGVFAPSLVIGSTLGAAVGLVGAQLIPGVTATPGAFALAGMTAVIAGGMRSPLGGMMIVLEMTDDYGLILPLMLVSAVATFVAGRMEPESLYTWKLRRLKVRFRPAIEPEHLAQITVLDILEPAAAVTLATPLTQVMALLRAPEVLGVAVLDARGRYAGFIQPIDLALYLEEEPAAPGLILAADLLGPEGNVTGPEEDLALVHAELALAEGGALPVVDAKGRFQGVVRHAGLMRRYREQILETQAA